MEELKRLIHLEIQVLNSSLAANSWDNCDDDETPDFLLRQRDHAQIAAYQKVLELISKL